MSGREEDIGGFIDGGYFIARPAERSAHMDAGLLPEKLVTATDCIVDLVYAFEGSLELTSIDIDEDICDVFRYRQQREGHKNPASVLAIDLLTMPVAPESDLVTLVGSTAHETGNAEKALRQAAAMLREGGRLYYSDFDQLTHRGVFLDLLQPLGLRQDRFQASEEYGIYAFWATKCNRLHTGASAAARRE